MTFWHIYLLEINAVAAVLCWLDKRRARRKLWRVPEGTLLLCAALGGSAGLLLTMLLLWHKVQRPRFILWVPFLLLLQLSAAYYLKF